MLEEVRKNLEFHRDSDQLLFPILVEIRKFEDALAKKPDPGYNILDYLYDSVSQDYTLCLPDGFFEKYLDSGRALLMFDGLDEVALESRRAEVRRMISSFATSRHPGNTVIVTSRIAGYNRAQFSTTDYRYFTLEDFNEAEIETFIHRWYRSRLSNPAEADSRANDLKEALWKKPRIKELARNPLLLTIIGVIHRYETQLPEDRLVLYDKATEALLYTWDNVRAIIDERFKLSHRRWFLGKVAFHLQSLEKGDEAGTMMDRYELYGILLADFCKVFDCETLEAKGLVDEFLEAIRLRALRSLHAQKVLEHILTRDTKGIESYFYHNHYFVMKFIAEQGQWLDNKEFVEKQIDDFFNFSWNEGRNRGEYRNFAWIRFREWLASVSDSDISSRLFNKLLSIIENDEHPIYLRRSCADAAGNLTFKKETTADRLLVLAEDESQHVYLRRSCAETVGNLGFKEKAVELLLGLTEDGKEEFSLRRSCALSIGKLGVKDKAVEILIDLYLSQSDKANSNARLTYNSLWELTAG